MLLFICLVAFSLSLWISCFCFCFVLIWMIMDSSPLQFTFFHKHTGGIGSNMKIIHRCNSFFIDRNFKMFKTIRKLCVKVSVVYYSLVLRHTAHYQNSIESVLISAEVCFLAVCCKLNGLIYHRKYILQIIYISRVQQEWNEHFKFSKSVSTCSRWVQ